jgi:hypothetical protein
MLIGFVGGSASTTVIYLTLNFSDFLYTQRSYLSYFLSTGMMGVVWLPVTCAASRAFRKFTELNDLLSSKLSINILNEIKQSQLFKSAVENEDRITTNQIIKIIKNSKDKDYINTDLSNVGKYPRSFNSSTFINNFIKFYMVGIKLLDIYKSSRKFKPLNPTYFTFVISFIVAINVLKNDPSYRGLIIVLYYVLYTAFFHSLQMFFYRKIKNWVWLSDLCDVLNILALTVTGYFLHTYYDFFTTLNSSMISVYISAIALYLFLSFTGHISQSASLSYTYRKANLEKYLNSDSFKLKILNQEIEKDALKWEQIIHGKLQSKILSNSVKEMSGSGNQALPKSKFIAEVKDLITQSLTTASKRSANPTEIIELVSKPWSAVIDIQSEIDSSIAKQMLSPSITQTVTDVLEEAITNAVKHGGAEQVWLVIKGESSNSIELQIKNNGASIGKAKRQSIGTNLFNQSGIWSISNENGLVVFKIQIAV